MRFNRNEERSPNGQQRLTKLDLRKMLLPAWLFFVCSLTALLSACAGVSTSSPAAKPGITVSISPTSATVTIGNTQQFSATVLGTSDNSVTWSVNGVTGGDATAGTISTKGLYTAPATVPSNPVITITATSAASSSASASAAVTISPTTAPTVIVTISPTSVTVLTSNTLQFSAAVSGTSDNSVTWSVNGITGGNATAGTISTQGLYTAPAIVPSNPVVTITATSTASSSASASAAVTISSPVVQSGISVWISPTSAMVLIANTLQFSATVSGTSNNSVTWSVNGITGRNATTGTISTQGLYTAPATVPSNPQVTITATSAASSSASASAAVTISSGITVSISPTSATVTTGNTQQFSASVSGTSDNSVTWSVNGITGGSATTGTISTQGLYTAPATVPSNPGVTITATSLASSSASASAVATISSASVQGIPATLFGLNLHPEVLTGQVPWPAFSFGTIRLWNTQTAWTDINPSNGVYDWSQLDSWLDTGKSKGITSFVYTFGKGTPTWAAANPGDTTCNKPGTPSTPGECDPPSDVDTGNQYFKNFVTALVQHAAGRIETWECINEPDVPEQWNGTMAQALTMCTDMYNIVKAIDPTAMVTTPAPVAYSGGQTPGGWMTTYLQMGGGKVADVIAFHGYQNATLAQSPEVINNIAQGVTTAAKGNGATSKPVWDTEMSWDSNSNLPDPDLEAGFVARVYLLQWSNGVSRFYWFQYGAQNVGTLWTPTAGDSEAATAYGVVDSWMVGATLASSCVANGTVWTCDFTKSSGAQAQAVWDASQTCSNGTCTTSFYSPNSVYIQYVDLAGVVHPFSAGNTVQIGAKPILLESQ